MLLYADESTIKVIRIFFAITCVVMTIDGAYPERYMVETEFGTEFYIKFEYG